MSLPTFVGDHSRAGTPEPTLVDKVQGAFNHYSTYHGHNQIFSPISHTNVHQCQNPASSLSSSCNTYLPHANTDSQVHPRIPLSVEFLGAGSYDQSSTMSCQPQGRYKVSHLVLLLKDGKTRSTTPPNKLPACVRFLSIDLISPPLSFKQTNLA